MKYTSSKLEQVNKIKEGMDLQRLVDEAYRILENPIILYDLDWKIIAYPKDVITDDPIWNNHVGSGTITKRTDIYINEGFVDMMTKPEKVVLLSSYNVKYDRFFGKIHDKDSNIIAGISVVASHKPFEEDDLMVTEAICKILSNEMQKIPDYQNAAQTKLESCINMLIENELKDIADRVYVSGYVEMIYHGLKSNLYLAVADFIQNNLTRAMLEYYKNIFKQIRPAFKYSIYANYLVIIMSTDEAIFYPKKVFGSLGKIFEQEHIKVGISRRFENLFDLRKYFTEAVCALKYGSDSNGDWVFYMPDANRQ